MIRLIVSFTRLHVPAELVELTEEGQAHVVTGTAEDDVHHELLHMWEAIERVEEGTAQLHAHHQQLQCLASNGRILGWRGWRGNSLKRVWDKVNTMVTPCCI